MAKTFNPYKVLGVKEDATPEKIKAAFRKLSKEHHPDTHKGEASQEFIDIKKAYDILTNQSKRDTFDIYGIVIDFYDETRKLAFNIFLEVASSLKKGFPLDIEIKTYVEEGLIPKYENDMKAAEEKKDRLESRLSGIVSRPTEDFITEQTLKVIEKHEQEYKVALLMKDLHKAALKLLQEYKFDLDQIESPGRRTLSSRRVNRPSGAEVWIHSLDTRGDGL